MDLLDHFISSSPVQKTDGQLSGGLDNSPAGGWPVRSFPDKISPAEGRGMETPGGNVNSLSEAQRNVLATFDVCEVCRHYVLKTMTCSFDPATLDREFQLWIQHQKSRKCHKFGLTTKHIGNGAPSGLFAFTLTKSETDPLSVCDMVAAVRKVMAQKSCKVLRYAWYYEDKGQDAMANPIHPHIHGIYETEKGGRIEAKHFKRAWPIWDEHKPMGAGFRGGYHRPVRSDEAYENYIKKDGGLSESMGMD